MCIRDRLSYCERGKYIAEFLGAKDHLVVPYLELLSRVREGKEFEMCIRDRPTIGWRVRGA